MKLNDTIEVILHLKPNTSNTIPADPIFNVLKKVDLLLGADVIEDILFDSKIKANRLCIRDSIFAWVWSCVFVWQKQRCVPHDYNSKL